MIRQATWDDLDAVEQIFEHIIEEEEKGNIVVGWKRDIYPTRNTAITALQNNDLFVLEEEGRIIAAMRLNQEQMPAYRKCQWDYPAEDNQVMVMHTLVVDPAESKHGYGKQMITYYEAYAAGNKCPYLRIDTNAANTRARALYKKLGYKEIGIIPGVFCGIAGVNLVCMEKKLA